MSAPTPAKFFNVFIDSDGVIADFDTALVNSGLPADEFKMLPGIYLWLNEMPAAATALSRLKELDDTGEIRVWVLTKTPSGSPYAYTEKVLWYREHFPWLEDRVIVAHDKHLMGTGEDFLLDDRPHKANADKFRGTFIEFNPKESVSSWANFYDAVTSQVDKFRRSQPKFKVRDGVADYGHFVWYRGPAGPEIVVLGETNAKNVTDHPEMYSINRPAFG